LGSRDEEFLRARVLVETIMGKRGVSIASSAIVA
jgi:hypothetical protein